MHEFTWAYTEGGRGEPRPSPKSLGENISFLILGKMKIINVKEKTEVRKKERISIMFLRKC